MTLQPLVSNRQSIQGLDRLLRISMLLILKKAIPLRNVPLLHQVKKLQPPKSLTYLSYLLVHKRQRQTAQINLIVLTCLLQLFLLQVPLCKKILWFDHLERCSAFDVIHFRMLIEKVLDSSRWHCENCECPCAVEFHVLDRRWCRQLRVWGWYQCVKILEKLFHCNLERQVVANYFCWVILCVCVLDLFLSSQFCTIVQFAFLCKLQDLLLIHLLWLVFKFVFLLFLLFVLLNKRTILFIGDNRLFCLFGALVGDQVHVHVSDFLYLNSYKFYNFSYNKN